MDDWDSVTKIGRNVTRGEGPARETVIRGKANLNAAMRTGGIVATEKKFATANAAAFNVNGQKLTKVAESPDIIVPNTVGKEVGNAIMAQRNKTTPAMKQSELATKCNTTVSMVQAFENGSAQPDQKILTSMEKVLGIKLRGSNIGAPRFGPKKK